MNARREALPRIRRWLLAAALGTSMLASMPWAVAAADEPSATPTATPEPTPVPTATSQTPRRTPDITKFNLYRSTAMVGQYTNYWCVPAATQSMVNLVRRTSNRSYATQKFYYQKIRQHNRYYYATRGNDPQGWA